MFDEKTVFKIVIYKCLISLKSKNISQNKKLSVLPDF